MHHRRPPGRRHDLAPAGRRAVAGARVARVVALTLALTGATACGKKGPPLPPLVRVPQATGEVSARRVGDAVLLTLRLPSQNIDGSTPADLVRVDLFALTTAAPADAATVLERGTRIGTVSVPAPPRASSATTPPPPAGPRPGEDVTLHERLTGAALTPVALPAPAPATAPNAKEVAGGSESRGTPAVEPPALRRSYVAVAFGPGDRRSQPGPVTSLDLSPAPDTPQDLALTHTEAEAVLTWREVSGTASYNVYRAESDRPVDDADAAAFSLTPLNPKPLDTPRFAEAYTAGEQRCYFLRAQLTSPGGTRVESPSSAVRCHTFADIFPPAAPTELDAVPGTGEVTLIWTASTSPDVAGYLILRGRAGDDTLAEITASPVTGTRYVDRTVTPGVLYDYAVIAVDSRAPVPNRSAPSARDDAAPR